MFFSAKSQIVNYVFQVEDTAVSPSVPYPEVENMINCGQDHTLGRKIVKTVTVSQVWVEPCEETGLDVFDRSRFLVSFPFAGTLQSARKDARSVLRRQIKGCQQNIIPHLFRIV